MKSWAVALALWALAAVALGVSLANRYREDDVSSGWTGYPPNESDAYDFLSATQPLLWLGVAIGLALSGLVVLLAPRLARTS